jgi:hypothetical protein
MKTVVAVVMGFLSGFLIYMMASMLFADFSSHQEPSGVFVFVTFIGGWALSSWLLLKGARTTARVLSRGFLLGAAEWFSMILVGVVFSGRATGASIASSTGSGAEAAGAAIGGGLVAFLTGGISIFMAVLCLLGFVIVHFTAREMKTESAEPTKKCPMCAELVQMEARRCKHCGADLVASP